MYAVRNFIFSFLFGAISITSTHAQDTPPPAVVVAPVQSEELSLSAVFTGRVDAVQHVEIRARVDGFVQNVGFAEGQTVTSGDVLFEIEPDAYEAAVQQIEGQIDSAQAQKTLAEIDLQRQQELLDREVAAEVTVQRAEATAGDIDGQIVQLEGALKEAKLNLSYTDVVAPFDGRVGLTEFDLGAYIGPETGTLVTLASIDPTYVTFPVPEATFLDVRKRHQEAGTATTPDAQITLANGDVYDHTGKVEIIDTVVQPGTDTILIRASFPNPDGLLRDGQLVAIKLVENDAETALTFPVEALQRDQAGYFVYTVGDDDTVAKTPIEVDRIEGARVAISSGLTEGQNVITEGIQKVQPGAKVQVQQASTAAPAQ